MNADQAVKQKKVHLPLYSGMTADLVYIVNFPNTSVK